MRYSSVPPFMGRAVDAVLRPLIAEVRAALGSTLMNRASESLASVLVEPLEKRQLLDATALTTSLLPEADAYTQGGSTANTNYGTPTTITVKDDSDPVRDRETYLRFDISSIGDRVPTDVTAKLRLKVTAGGNDVPTTRFRIELLADANDGWSETGLTYNNRPQTNTTVVSTYQGYGNPVGDNFIELDVTSAVRKTLANDPSGKVSLRVRSLTEGFERAVTFGSRENPTAAFRPQLLVQEGALYYNDFQAGVGGGAAGGVMATWNKSTIGTTPTDQRKFLGELGSETATLNLSGLPVHDTVQVEFDLYLIRTWDGNYTPNGPDRWQLKADNATLLDTTFSNSIPGQTQGTQNYPTANSPSRTGANERNSLGYTFNYTSGGTQLTDTVYRISKTFTHTGGTLKLDFAALGLQALSDESWGITNVAVRSDTTSSVGNGFQAGFRFGPDNSATVPGYITDIGEQFHDGSSGYTYGWTNEATGANAQNSGNARGDVHAAPALKNSAVGTVKNGVPLAWEVAVPNGSYYVKLVAGDPTLSSGTYQYGVENISNFLSGTGQFVTGTGTVTVTDGKLKIFNGGSSDHALSYVEITDAGGRARNVIMAPSNVAATAAGSTAVDVRWRDASDNETGFRVDRTTDPSGTWTQVGTTYANAGYFTDTTTAANTTYYYRVIATKGSAFSHASSNPITTPTTGVGQTPYNATRSPWPTDAMIQAENFDAGGDGVSYDNDLIAGNAGGYYRRGDTDIGYNIPNSRNFVGWTRASEWMEYTFNVAQPGTYVLDAFVAAEDGAGSLSIQMNGVDKGTVLNIPNTFSFNNYQAINSASFTLSAGPQVLRLTAVAGGSPYFVGDIDWLKLRKLSDSTTPSTQPEPPTNLSATGIAPGRIALVWQKSVSVNVLHYNIYRSRSSVFVPDEDSFVGSVTSGETRFIDSGLSVGKQYYYYVLAEDRTGALSEKSNLASAISKNQDQDIDNDGTTNENDDDSDNDGIIDSADPDDDNDGVPDQDDSDDGDADNDGIKDWTDDDNDNDGTPDTDDEDNDNDGTPDETDTDDDGNGTDDSDEPLDTDGDNDGSTDPVDTDDDGDGIPDATDTDDDNDDVLDDGDPDSPLVQPIVSPAKPDVFRFNLRGDYAASGVGLRGKTSGTIAVSSIPADSGVKAAYLYWGYLDNGESASLKSLSFAGHSIKGTHIGSGPDTCWGRQNSHAYRANVTEFVNGNGSYSIGGVASGGQILAEGATLVVVYENEDLPAKQVILVDSNQVYNGGSGSVPKRTIDRILAVAPATGSYNATTSFIVGDGQYPAGTGNTTFSGSGGALEVPGAFGGTDGSLWDTDTYDVSSYLRPGDESVKASIGGGSDCLMWVAQITSVSSVLIDLDVDSNNDGTIDKHDDGIEDDVNKLGKVALINDLDRDRDALPDFVDGYDAFESVTVDNASTAKFVPVNIRLPDIDLSSAKIKFTYLDSAPLDITSQLNGYTLGDGKMRLWTKDGDVLRDGKAKTESGGGDFISTDIYSINTLFGTEKTKTFFAEIVRLSTANGDQKIKVELDINGDGQYEVDDAVRLTGTGVELVSYDYDGNSRTTRSFVPSDFGRTPDEFTYARLQTYAIRVFDPRQSELSNLTIAGQTLPLHLVSSGEYETAEFAIKKSGDTTSWTPADMPVIELNGSNVELSYNPGWTWLFGGAPVNDLPAGFEDLAKVMKEEVDAMQAAGWAPANPADSGAFGKEVHRRVGQRLNGQAGWLVDVYVAPQADGSHKIASIGAVPAGGVVGTTQIDMLHVAGGYTPQVGDVLDRAKVNNLFDIKASLGIGFSGPQGQAQLSRLKAVVGGGDIVVAKTHTRWTANGWKATKKFAMSKELLGYLGAAAAVWALLNFHDQDAEVDAILVDAERVLQRQQGGHYEGLDGMSQRLVDLQSLNVKFSDYIGNFAPDSTITDLVKGINTMVIVQKVLEAQ